MQLIYTNHTDELPISSILTHANVFHLPKRVKIWNDFWCESFQDCEEQIIRRYKPTRHLEPFKKATGPKPGDVVALVPLGKHKGMSEVWEIVHMKDGKDDSEKKVTGRRMKRRNEVDKVEAVARGASNEFLRSVEVVEIKRFWERWGQEPRVMYMEYVDHVPGSDEVPDDQLPDHLHLFFGGAGGIVSVSSWIRCSIDWLMLGVGIFPARVERGYKRITNNN